uniref:Uncharacterized protein n=1 Tax=Nelumbo nucifera TaxID=4432 RepID=A0A822Z9Y9_NELNU|nr:TPA_asm: hypothetical protein HUJ06_014542 [Nelumbo nucifera]
MRPTPSKQTLCKILISEDKLEKIIVNNRRYEGKILMGKIHNEYRDFFYLDKIVLEFTTQKYIIDHSFQYGSFTNHTLVDTPKLKNSKEEEMEPGLGPQVNSVLLCI